MEKELWIAHCLRTGNGRVLVGISDSRRNANKLHKKMRDDLSCGDDIWADEFVCTTKKVKKLNEVALDLT